MRVHRDLNLKLFYKGSPLPLPQWFHYRKDCHLTKKSMMQNVLNYIRLEREQTFNILEELKELNFIKKIALLSNVIRYSPLRYNSSQTYWLLIKEFPFPSLSLLKKSYFQHLNTMVLQTKFYLKVVKRLGNYITMFWKR